MRIDPQNPTIGATGASSAENIQTTQVKAPQSQRTALPEPSDTVQLSGGAATVQQLVSQLGEIPDVRQEQVSALRSALDSGRYNPSNAQVAEALAAQSFGVSEQA